MQELWFLECQGLRIIVTQEKTVINPPLTSSRAPGRMAALSTSGNLSVPSSHSTHSLKGESSNRLYVKSHFSKDRQSFQAALA